MEEHSLRFFITLHWNVPCVIIVECREFETTCIDDLPVSLTGIVHVPLHIDLNRTNNSMHRRCTCENFYAELEDSKVADSKVEDPKL